MVSLPTLMTLISMQYYKYLEFWSGFLHIVRTPVGDYRLYEGKLSTRGKVAHTDTNINREIRVH